MTRSWKALKMMLLNTFRAT